MASIFTKTTFTFVFLAGFILSFTSSVAVAATLTSDVRVKAVDFYNLNGAQLIRVRFLKSDGGPIDSDAGCPTWWTLLPENLTEKNMDRLLSILLTAQAQQSSAFVVTQSNGTDCYIDRFQIEH